MISTKVFYERKAICEQCPNWKSVCLKGHALASPVGCPEKRFPPVEGAVYMEDRPAATGEVKPGKCCGQGEGDLKEFSFSEVTKEFASSMRTWASSGFELSSEQVYHARLDACKHCEHYKWYQCRICKCVMYVKAKLKTTTCPAGYWRS